MRRILRGILIGGLITVLVSFPVLAAYYAYITVAESSGNSYEELPIIVSRNTTQLVQYGLMSSTGLDSRVLTGDGYPLPHMLADNKVLFISDLAAHETKTLVFYLGATSLSSFPIIVGYNGSFKTPDDPALELGYVMELLIDGYFNAEASDVGHNILYKEDAFRVWISAKDEIKVAAYNSTGYEQWEMHYSSFMTGGHIVYILANGLAAYLYVDNFEVAKDTVNLYNSVYYQISDTKDANMCDIGSYYEGGYPRTFYANNMYWAFYTKSTNNIAFFYKTSVDGSSWSSEYSVGVYGTDTLGKWSVWLDATGYMHIAYPDNRGTGAPDHIRYRRGYPEINSTITWSADWQTVDTEGSNILCYHRVMVVADPNGYPMIMWCETYGTGGCDTDHYIYLTKSTTNNGIWTPGGGYLTRTQGMQCAPPQWLVQCPNSTKAYYIYARMVGGYFKIIEGRYFDGGSWSGSADTILSSDTALGYTRVCGVADNSDNFYLFYLDSTSGVIYMKIRYSDGSWSFAISVASGSSPTVSYSTTRNMVYIFYLSGGYIVCRGLNIGEGTISAAYSIAAYTTGSPAFQGISSTPYSDNQFGILYATHGTNSVSSTAHAILRFPWEWNDNNNDWYWMQNNVMPYISDTQLAVDGVLQLEYKPASIILGTTLPDEENDHDGIITWGSNPIGVTATMEAFQSDIEEGGQTVAPGMVGPQDMIGPTGQQDRTSEVGTLTGNPFYPLVKVLSDNTHIPVQLCWVIIASIIVMIAMVVTYKYLPHQMIVALVGGGLSSFFYGMGIYPFWVPLIFAVMALAIILGERSPVV